MTAAAPPLISRPDNEHSETNPDRPVELYADIGLDIHPAGCVGVHHDDLPPPELGVPGQLLLAVPSLWATQKF